MSPDDVRKILDELFERPIAGDGSPSAAGEGQKLLDALTADLAARYPELQLDRLLNQAKTDAVARADRIDAKTPAIRLMPPEVVGPTGGLNDPCCFPPDEECRPARMTSGWFASHAFRIARMHHDGAVLCQQLRRTDGEAQELVRKVRARLLRNFGKQGESKIDDALQNAFLRLLRKAGMFDCAQEFSPWFLRLLSNEIINYYRGSIAFEDHGIDHLEEVGSDDSTATKRTDSGTEGGEDWIKRLIDDEIEITPDHLKIAAREVLRREGQTDPSPDVLGREVERLRRLYQEAVIKHVRNCVKKGEAVPPQSLVDAAGFESEASDRVDTSLYELIVALANHSDYTRAVPEGDLARAELLSIRDDIEALIEFQETSDRGPKKSPRGESRAASDAAASGTVDRLARIQSKGWGLVKHPPDQGPVWNAARNLRWLSSLLEAASTLATCLRHAVRLGDPALGPFATHLRRQTCLRTFKQEVRKALKPHADALDARPPVPSTDADAEGATLLRLALSQARGMTEKSKAPAVASRLPGVDWEWWISRVTGRNTDRADAAVRQLAELAALGRPARQIQ